ncbi:MAG: helix-turn-helix domain-containing protein [Leucobacter sp.]
MSAKMLPRIAYTVAEVAQMLGRTENAIRLAIRDGAMPSERIAGRVMIPASYIEELQKL